MSQPRVRSKIQRWGRTWKPRVVGSPGSRRGPRRRRPAKPNEALPADAAPITRQAETRKAAYTRKHIEKSPHDGDWRGPCPGDATADRHFPRIYMPRSFEAPTHDHLSRRRQRP